MRRLKILKQGASTARGGRCAKHPGQPGQAPEWGCRGQAAAEFAITILVLVLIMSGIFIAGALTYVHVGVLTAAEDCAYAAAQSLDPGQSRFQGISAAQETLGSLNLHASSATITVASDWRRGAPITCTVGYRVDVAAIPFSENFGATGNVQYSVALPAQAFKSVWR